MTEEQLSYVLQQVPEGADGVHVVVALTSGDSYSGYAFEPLKMGMLMLDSSDIPGSVIWIDISTIAVVWGK